MALKSADTRCHKALVLLSGSLSTLRSNALRVFWEPGVKISCRGIAPGGRSTPPKGQSSL
ncbi:MAG: hypothetical protein HC767_07850 [Akkermansiaceae bacterium]|nr:hypothetical protein [Akkermansiaceae bacterium]